MLVKGNDKMRIEKELCQKFPTVLKDKLLKNERLLNLNMKIYTHIEL